MQINGPGILQFSPRSNDSSKTRFVLLTNSSEVKNNRSAFASSVCPQNQNFGHCHVSADLVPVRPCKSDPCKSVSPRIPTTDVT